MNVRHVVLAISMALAGCGGSGSPVVAVSDVSKTPIAALPPAPRIAAEPTGQMVPYGMIQGSGPMVILLALDMQNTLYNPASTDNEVSYLISAGFTVLSMDMPYHGNAPGANPATDPLYFWAWNIAAGQDTLFTQFCANLSDVLDSIGVKEASIVGISRGGYMAVTCAAYDTRLKNIVLLKPVTDLNFLTEFAAPYQVNESEFNIQQFIPYIKDRNILVRIGNADDRVSTPLAEAFAHEVGATLQVLDIVGHSAPEDGSTITWLSAHL